MPTLYWIGKAAVVTHHKEVPFRLLEPVPELSAGDAESDNFIVQGDNLHALKALLPRYAGQVKCIYIVPPTMRWRVLVDTFLRLDYQSWRRCSMGNKQGRNHTKEFKEEAVKLVSEQGYAISEAARNLGVNPNLLGCWKREKSPRQIENETLISIVKRTSKESRESYGTRRISEEIEASGTPCGRYRARTLTNLSGVSVRGRKKFKVTTDSKHNLPIAPNLLDHVIAGAETPEGTCAASGAMRIAFRPNHGEYHTT